MAQCLTFSGRVLCQLEPCGSTEVNQAVEAAKSAFDHWSKVSGMDRARILIQAAHIIEVVKHGPAGITSSAGSLF